MTNVGTGTAFRHDHIASMSKNVSIPSVRGQLMRSSVCTHQKRKHSSRAEFTPETTLMVLEVDCRQPAGSLLGDLLITMVKETKILFKKEIRGNKKVKLFYISHCSDSDENAIDCEIACHFFKHTNVVADLWPRKENFARTHTATND